MEMLSDLPSNTIDNNWMSIPQITYAVQWLLIRKVLHKNVVYVFMFYILFFPDTWPVNIITAAIS